MGWASDDENNVEIDDFSFEEEKDESNNIISSKKTKEINKYFYQTENMNFYFDLWKKPIFIAAPKKGKNSILKYSPEDLKMFFSEMDQFTREFKIPKLQITLKMDSKPKGTFYFKLFVGKYLFHKIKSGVNNNKH
jgi:hypothetical protein